MDQHNTADSKTPWGAARVFCRLTAGGSAQCTGVSVHWSQWPRRVSCQISQVCPLEKAHHEWRLHAANVGPEDWARAAAAFCSVACGHHRAQGPLFRDAKNPDIGMAGFTLRPKDCEVTTCALYPYSPRGRRAWLTALVNYVSGDRGRLMPPVKIWWEPPIGHPYHFKPWPWNDAHTSCAQPVH